MKDLPGGVVHYKSTPEFTEQTIPAGLLRAHTTAVGVWGRIRVIEGRLRYRIDEPRLEVHLLAPGTPGVVEPQVRHEVEPVGPVRFCVDFFR